MTPRSRTADVSLPRLYLLRAGYALMGGGLAVVKWPELFHRDQPWPLMDGVVTCMLVALSVLALLGLRYPLQMLPILLFEVGWKFTWMAVVALPLRVAGGLDPATESVFVECALVVTIIAVIPWRHVLATYVTSPGERWRPDPSPSRRRPTPARR